MAAALPEKRIFIETTGGTRYLRMTTGAQAVLVVLTLALVGSFVVATADVAADLVAADGEAGRSLVLHDAYRTRLNDLTAERDVRAAEALSAQNRFRLAMEQISRQQTALLHAIEERRDLETSLDLTRARVGDAIEQRDLVAAANERLLAQMTAKSASLQAGASRPDLADTLQAITGALADAVEARDTATADRETLAAELAASELELRVTTRRQDEMIDQIRQSVAASFAPLEAVLKKAELDVDSVLASVRQDYSGEGGPLVPMGMSTRSYPGEAEAISRFDELMIDIDRMNLLRIALGKAPFAAPVQHSFRLTSGFGFRGDPHGRGRRMHEGVDFAAPTGTPIYATADGSVTTAAVESGYGKVIRIQHAFGFETLYAHQSRLLVKLGQQVSRGDHIGDIGSTGRSTGPHLHYEVRLNGRPLDPMTLVEAAKDVF